MFYFEFETVLKFYNLEARSNILSIKPYQVSVYDFIHVPFIQNSHDFFCLIVYVFSVLCLLCLCERLFKCALWPPAGKGLTPWLSFVVSDCEFVTSALVSWVRCGT